MMGADWGKGHDMVMTIDGRVVGNMQSITVKPYREFEPVDELAPITDGERFMIQNYGRAVLDDRPISHIPYSGTLNLAGGHNVITEAGKKMLLDMMKEQLPTFDIEATVFKYTPPRKIRSKKKRLRKKWAKLYGKSILRKTEYKNCVVSGVSS